MSEIISLYTDGGVCVRNSSSIGGSWAWCWVDASGQRIREESGYVTPAVIGLPTVTNNYTELLAAVRGMESLPANWNGTIYTDSQITKYRITFSNKFAGIPDDLRLRTLAARKHLGFYKVVLLGGHPTRADLIRGCRNDGLPVSPHNVCCDRLCGEQGGSW